MLIQHSVGRDGDNARSDIQIVVQLLHHVRHLLVEREALFLSGMDEASLVTLIERFQRRAVLMRRPDGRIDPQGRTLKKLLEYASDIAPLRPLFPCATAPQQGYDQGSRAFGAWRNGGRRRHAGCDLIYPQGTAVRAMEDGIVLRRPYPFYQGTWALEVDHGAFIARYGEMAEPHHLFSKGEPLERGACIGRVGRLALLNRSMLHLELYAGSQQGALTQRRHAPYQRRSDLLDPTEFLAAAVID